MGKLVADRSVPQIQAQLNQRFAPGDDVVLMASLHQEFDLFASGKALRHTAALLNILPAGQADRDGWFRYLDNLKKVGSDVPGQNGHDRIISALKENFAARRPLPVHFTWHLQSEDPGVRVTRGTPLSFSHETYLIISGPTKPVATKAGASKRPRNR